MKKISISFLLTAIVVIGCAQQVTQPKTLSADVYRKKAKEQRVAAAVLGVTGVVLITGTSIYALNHLFENNDNLEAPFIIGCVFTVGSIPFIIAADKNSKKAKKLSTSFMLQRTPPLIAAIKSTICYPTVGIHIQF